MGDVFEDEFHKTQSHCRTLLCLSNLQRHTGVQLRLSILGGYILTCLGCMDEHFGLQLHFIISHASDGLCDAAKKLDYPGSGLESFRNYIIFRYTDLFPLVAKCQIGSFCCYPPSVGKWGSKADQQKTLFFVT